MSKKDIAKDLLGDLIDGDEELQKAIASAEEEPTTPDIQYIVYYNGELPDCAWVYYHKPEDGVPYGKRHGYWDEDKEEKVSRHFVEVNSNNYILGTFDEVLEHISDQVPNKDALRVFDSEGDFLLDLI